MNEAGISSHLAQFNIKVCKELSVDGYMLDNRCSNSEVASFTVFNGHTFVERFQLSGLQWVSYP